MAVLLAVERWRPYLQHQEFVIMTDHHILVHLSDQRLHTPWKQRAFTKLMGLHYKICYRKVSTNSAVDALSRKDNLGDEQAMAISSGVPMWIQEVVQGYDKDEFSSQLLTELAVQPTTREHFSLQNGLLRYKGRVWVGDNSELQHKLIVEMHDNPVGGHSGFSVTYRKLKHLFAWKGMKQQVKQYVSQCQVCLQAKPERVVYPGLPRPLLVPEGAWQVISMDFIEGLPVSDRYSCIMVVIDKFSKFAQFLPLSHPCTASHQSVLGVSIR